MRLLLISILSLLSGIANAQRFSAAMGMDVTLTQKQSFVRVIHADEKGSYVLENRYKNLNVYYSNAMIQILYKFDHRCNLKFTRNYEKELENNFIDKFIMADDAFYAFSKTLLPKEKKFVLSVGKISTADGSVQSPFKEIFQANFTSKDAGEFTYEVVKSQDGKGFHVTVNQASEKESKLFLIQVDKSLAAIAPRIINYGAGKDLAVLDETFFLDNKVVVSTRRFDYTSQKRKKRFLKEFGIATYNLAGEKLSEFATAVEGKFIRSARLLRGAGDKFFLAGFFGNEVDDEVNTGAFVNTLDLNTAKTANSVTRPLNMAMAGFAKQGSKSAADGLDGEYLIKAFLPNPELGGYTLVGERVYTSTYSSTSFNSDLSKGFTGANSRSGASFRSYDIVFVGIDASGSISSLQCVTKSQSESLSDNGGGSNGLAFAMDGPYSLHRMIDFPLYSSISVLPGKKALHVIFNDHENNMSIVGPNNDCEVTRDFDKSMVFVLNMDYKTGKITRNTVAVTNEEFVLMHKAHFQAGNSLVIPAKNIRKLGNHKFRLNRLTLVER